MLVYGSNSQYLLLAHPTYTILMANLNLNHWVQAVLNDHLSLPSSSLNMHKHFDESNPSLFSGRAKVITMKCVS